MSTDDQGSIERGKDTDSDVSIATSEVLSENDKDLLKTPDQTIDAKLDDAEQDEIKKTAEQIHREKGAVSQLQKGKGDLYQKSPHHSRTVFKPEEKEVIETLHGEIYSLKNMMDQKDNLLERMNHVFQEKDSIIHELKHQLNSTSFEVNSLHSKKDFRHIKKIFQPSLQRRDSGTQSDRSLHSLVYLIQKTQNESPKRVKKDVSPEDQALSESNTETLSGSSTTSIVGK